METTHSTTGLSICIKFDMTLIFMFQDESEGEEEEALEVKEEAEQKVEDKKQKKKEKEQEKKKEKEQEKKKEKKEQSKQNDVKTEAKTETNNEESEMAPEAMPERANYLFIKENRKERIQCLLRPKSGEPWYKVVEKKSVEEGEEESGVESSGYWLMKVEKYAKKLLDEEIANFNNQVCVFSSFIVSVTFDIQSYIF